MTTILWAVTLVSVAAALASLTYVVLVVRNERDRSEARVAALMAAIETQSGIPEATRRAPAVDANPLAAFAREPDPDRRSISGTGRLASASIAAGQLFATSESETPDAIPKKWVIAAAATVFAGVVLGSAFISRQSAVPVTASAASHGTPPLELVSLRHTHERTSLTIAGLVRNPKAASRRQDVQAVVFAFDAGGALVTSARTSLAEPSLAGGAQSPFSVTLSQADGIRRYRVSFRSGEHVVPHVDRRREPTGAQPGPTS